MFRTVFTLGSVIFELTTYATGEAFAGSAAVAGGVIMVAHAVAGSFLFGSVVNRITGFSLPEAREAENLAA